MTKLLPSGNTAVRNGFYRAETTSPVFTRHGYYKNAGDSRANVWKAFAGEINGLWTLSLARRPHGDVNSAADWAAGLPQTL